MEMLTYYYQTRDGRKYKMLGPVDRGNTLRKIPIGKGKWSNKHIGKTCDAKLNKFGNIVADLTDSRQDQIRIIGRSKNQMLIVDLNRFRSHRVTRYI